MSSSGEEALRENYMQEFEMTYKDKDILREWASDKTKDELIEFILQGTDYMISDEIQDFKGTMFNEFMENHKRGNLR